MQNMARGLVIRAVLWVGLVWPTGIGLAQGLDLDEPPSGFDLPRDYIEGQILQLNQQILQVQTRRHKHNDRYEAFADAGRIKLRQIAIELLSTVDVDPDTSMAALYGLTIASRVEDLDALFDMLPKQAHRVAQQDDDSPPDHSAQDRMKQMIAALNRFIQAKHTGPDQFQKDDPASVERYVYRLICPLAVLLDPAAPAQPRTTWLMGQDFQAIASGKPGPDQSDPSTIQQLMQRVEGWDHSPQSRSPLLAILKTLQAGSRYADIRPRAMRSYRIIAEVALLLEMVDASAWVNQIERAAFDQTLADVLMGYQNPVSRSEAEQRFRRLSETLEPILSGITRLQSHDVDTTSLRAVFSSVMQTAADKPPDHPSQSAVLIWLARVTQAMVEHQSLIDSSMPSEVRKVFLHLNVQYSGAEQVVLDQAKQLALDPRIVHHPATSTVGAILGKRVDQLRRVVHLPHWLELANSISHRPAYGINRRFNTLLTVMLNNDLKADHAQKELAAFEHQMTHYIELPGERVLRRQLEKDAKIVLGLPADVARILLDRVDHQRVEWVSAWASGQQHQEAGYIMSVLLRLMRWVTYTGSWHHETFSIVDLNRWGGWHVNPAAMVHWSRLTRTHLDHAVELVVAQQWQELEQSLDQIENNDAVILLMGALSHAWRDRIEDLPQGPAGALAELMYPPSPDAFMADHWQPFSVLCRYLNELSQPNLIDDVYLRQQLFDRCRVIIRDIVDDHNLNPTAAMASLKDHR